MAFLGLQYDSEREHCSASTQWDCKCFYSTFEAMVKGSKSVFRHKWIEKLDGLELPYNLSLSALTSKASLSNVMICTNIPFP